MAKKINWQVKTRLKEVKSSQIPDTELKSLMESGEGTKIMKAFMDILGERFQRRIREMNIGYEGYLSESMTSRVFKKQAHLRGTLSFWYYGRFVDMGVGKGVTLSEQTRGVAATSSRKGSSRRRAPKRWYSETMSGQRQKLSEIFAKAVAGQLSSKTAAGLRAKIDITI
ncbi:hypothetical protein [Telluribacter humicola]|uniref:hypothetical protein n=1 Tax=Telluribacter humicola TaxID=1720261 RepID=UPI001A9700B7|nr:hypothetical protein [Telluribacter humicola]